MNKLRNTIRLILTIDFVNCIAVMGLIISVPAVFAQSLVDPTRPLSASRIGPVDAQKAYELQGIYIRPDGRTAVVNGKVVEEGDHITGAKVISIAPNQVVIQYEDKNIHLHLARSILKPVSKGARNASD